MIFSLMEFYRSSVEATSPSLDTNRTSPIDCNEMKKKSLDGNSKGYYGILDVYIHQARDIHNICIYENQDVYAKFWLTNDPEQIVSTKIINLGGRNPIFNENVQFNVGGTINSTLRCEVWMLSRIRNYLEDQLLGFTFVPLSALLLIENSKLSKEFSLSSSDLLHSPAGFLQLTLTYKGAAPEIVMEIPKLNSSLVTTDLVDDSGSEVENATFDLDKLDRIEFLDLEISEQNESMASEYFMIPCPDMEVKSANQEYVNNVEAQVASGIEVPYQSPSSTATKTCSDPTPLNPQSAAANNYGSGIHETKKQVNVRDSKGEPGSAEVEESVIIPSKSLFTWPVSNTTTTITTRRASEVRQEQDVVQQDIIDIYTKSMNQFTETLAKMKLPLDIENGLNPKNVAENSVRSGCGENQDAPKDTTEPSSKVFYGSRAFF